jgi:glutamate-5-semialdehyde dehydrogenase
MDCTPIFKEVLKASRSLNVLETDVINKILLLVAEAAIAETGFIIAENSKDLASMDESDPKYDRLLLTSERIDAIASDIRNVASYPIRATGFWMLLSDPTD